MARRELPDPELDEELLPPLPKMKRRPADKMLRRHFDKASRPPNRKEPST